MAIRIAEPASTVLWRLLPEFDLPHKNYQVRSTCPRAQLKCSAVLRKKYLVDNYLPMSMNFSSLKAAYNCKRDWRAFRAHLVASEQEQGDAEGTVNVESANQGTTRVPPPKGQKAKRWAHAIHEPERGCLLVASPRLDGYAFFERSVILLLNTGGLDGPYGLVLNKPYARKVFGIKGLNPIISETFGPCQVNVGGPIDDRRFLLLHGVRDVSGFDEVMPGAYFGGARGMDAAVSLVKRGLADPEDFSLYFGYAGWDSAQLAREIALGWWYVAACSTEIVLKEPRENLWEDILELMGGQYRQLKRKLRGEASE
eukprot:jgi/Mesen1/983/ME000012S00527